MEPAPQVAGIAAVILCGGMHRHQPSFAYSIGVDGGGDGVLER